MADQKLLGGRYELGDLLGRGGMAEVRRAVDLRLGRPVAVKLLTGALAADSVFRTRFRREAQSVAGLNDPSIVAVFDTGEESDPVTGLAVPFIVMELVEGQTLRALMSGGHQLPPKRALEITQGVLDALTHSHAAGIVHRDIKPANVMVTPTGGVKVMDFGIARSVAETSTSLTQTAAVIGTAQYLSPEQARGETVDARSDIYSTGCLLYELLVGRPPFVGDTAISLAYQHVREEPSPPSQHNPLIHPQIEAIVLKALAKAPADRYQSAREMKDDIGRVLAGQLAAGPQTGITESAATAVAPAVLAAPPIEPDTMPGGSLEPVDEEPRRRRGGLVALVAVLVLLLVAGVGYGIYRALAPGETAALVTVPNVLGSTRAEAESTLLAADLSPRFREVNGKDDKTVNTIVKQDPLGGESVAADSVVTVDVNRGEQTAKIPDGLVGEDVDSVKKKLEKAGFSEVRVEKADDEPAGSDKDEVLSVDPDEGRTVALDERITVTVARGEESGSEDPATTRAPEPTKTRKPTKSASPTDSPEPTESEKPTESPGPSESPEPSQPQSGTTSPAPTPSKTATQSPEPSASSKPSGSTKPNGAAASDNADASQLGG